MKSFEDTHDPTEKLFKNKILLGFPNYAVFWETFIGYRDDSLPNLRPYGLKFPDTLTNKQKEEIENIYKDINQIHHHLFCSLSSAHFEKGNYLLHYGLKETQSYFIRQNAFNSFYIYIGICRDMVNRLVRCILLDLANESIRKPKKGTESGYLDAFGDYLENIDKNLARRFKAWKAKINKIRARLSHNGSIGRMNFNGHEFFPKTFSKDISWYRDWEEMSKGNRVLVREALETDLKETEEILNLLYNLFTKKYAEFLKKENITIDY